MSGGWCLNDELNDELCDRGKNRCFCEASISKPCVRRQCQRCTMIKSSYTRDKLAWPQAQESRPLAVQVLTYNTLLRSIHIGATHAAAAVQLAPAGGWHQPSALLRLVQLTPAATLAQPASGTCSCSNQAIAQAAPDVLVLLVLPLWCVALLLCCHLHVRKLHTHKHTQKQGALCNHGAITNLARCTCKASDEECATWLAASPQPCFSPARSRCLPLLGMTTSRQLPPRRTWPAPCPRSGGRCRGGAKGELHLSCHAPTCLESMAP